MIAASATFGVAVIAFGLVVTPGPNMVYLVLTTAGLAALFAAVPVFFLVVKTVGAAYLLYLAYGTLRPGGRPLFGGEPSAPAHSVRRTQRSQHLPLQDHR